MPMMLPPCTSQDLPCWEKLIPESEHQALVERARGEARAEAFEEAAELIRKFPRATQETMAGNYKSLARAARQSAQEKE